MEPETLDSDEQREVVEFLTFDVPDDRRDAWLDRDSVVWSSFLEAQPGFLRKEIWQSVDDPARLHAVIWWRSLAEWKTVSPAQVSTLDADMGSLATEPTMRSYRVVRHR